jgi:hypothetical protein
MLKTNKHNIKQTWKILNQALNKQITKPQIPDKFMVDDHLTSDKHLIAEKLKSPTDYLKSHYHCNFFTPTDPT